MELKLGIVLGRILKKKGMTLKELSKATNIKASTLSGWKNGVSPRDLVEVRKCAMFLGIGMERLLFDEESNCESLEYVKTEKIFDGFLKVNIERVIECKKLEEN